VADKAPKQQVDELRQLVVDYARQETVDPLKDLGKYIAWGLAGAILLGTGVVFVAIAVVRLLQTEGPDWLHKPGWSTTYPYLIVLVLLAIGAGATLSQTRKKPSAKTGDAKNSTRAS
jgi:hypothetical protein